MILPKERDPRFILIRRGGTLSDETHRLLAIWAAGCASHVLHLFEAQHPSDQRPRDAIESTLAWARGEIRTTQSKIAAYHANAAARDLAGAAKFAALSAGQAAVVAHVAAHELGAAAYAIRAAMYAAASEDKISAGRMECHWQRDQLPAEIMDLVLDDEKKRDAICWGLFGL